MLECRMCEEERGMRRGVGSELISGKLRKEHKGTCGDGERMGSRRNSNGGKERDQACEPDPVVMTLPGHPWMRRFSSRDVVVAGFL